MKIKAYRDGSNRNLRLLLNDAASPLVFTLQAASQLEASVLAELINVDLQLEYNDTLAAVKPTSNPAPKQEPETDTISKAKHVRVCAAHKANYTRLLSRYVVVANKVKVIKAVVKPNAH